jgi:hypothetical protein
MAGTGGFVKAHQDWYGFLIDLLVCVCFNVRDAVVLTLVSLYLGHHAGISIERAWLLLTLKSASMAAQPQQPSLSFFQAEVLGLARTCDKLAATIFAERNFYHTRVVELWGLFPAFCKRPSDLSSALSALTTTLARALEDSRYPQLVVSCGMN